MPPVTIDTDKIKDFALGVLAIIGLIAICGMICVCYVSMFYPHQTTVPVSVAQTPTPTPVPTQVQISYPTVLTFTALSTTTANGRYQITTTQGQILYISDYTTWNAIELQATYTATIVGMDGSAYDVGEINLINRRYQYWQNYNYNDGVKYYRYLDNYYQCDYNSCDHVSWKQASGERVIEGYPPRGVR
jgi:hypothetical protein